MQQQQEHSGYVEDDLTAFEEDIIVHCAISAGAGLLVVRCIDVISTVAEYELLAIYASRGCCVYCPIEILAPPQKTLGVHSRLYLV